MSGASGSVGWTTGSRALQRFAPPQWIGQSLSASTRARQCDGTLCMMQPGQVLDDASWEHCIEGVATRSVKNGQLSRRQVRYLLVEGGQTN